MTFFLVLLGCSPSEPQVASQPPSVTVVPLASATPRRKADPSYQRQLARIDAQLARAQTNAARRPTFIQPWLNVMDAHLTRARLVSGTADHVAAQQAFDRAKDLHPDTDDVRRAEARLLQTRHHFQEALNQLESLGHTTDADRSAMASLRFELGNYQTAVTELQAIPANRLDLGTPARLGAAHWKLGDWEQAESAFALASSRYHGRETWPVAWNHLMLGLMDLEREQYDDALAHYQDADAATPGWWLVQEHIAEIHLVQERPEVALPLYEAVVAETSNPEIMGALADTLDALGRTNDATAQRKRALSTFRSLVAEHPDLVGGHALEFLLEHGTPEEALSLAERNHRLRPNGESKLALATALERVDRRSEADALQAEVRASGWGEG